MRYDHFRRSDPAPPTRWGWSEIQRFDTFTTEKSDTKIPKFFSTKVNYRDFVITIISRVGNCRVLFWGHSRSFENFERNYFIVRIKKSNSDFNLKSNMTLSKHNECCRCVFNLLLYVARYFRARISELWVVLVRTLTSG